MARHAPHPPGGKQFEQTRRALHPSQSIENPLHYALLSLSNTKQFLYRPFLKHDQNAAKTSLRTCCKFRRERTILTIDKGNSAVQIDFHASSYLAVRYNILGQVFCIVTCSCKQIDGEFAKAILSRRIEALTARTGREKNKFCFVIFTDNYRFIYLFIYRLIYLK